MPVHNGFLPGRVWRTIRSHIRQRISYGFRSQNVRRHHLCNVVQSCVRMSTTTGNQCMSELQCGWGLRSKRTIALSGSAAVCVLTSGDYLGWYPIASKMSRALMVDILNWGVCCRSGWSPFRVQSNDTNALLILVSLPFWDSHYIGSGAKEIVFCLIAS